MRHCQPFVFAFLLSACHVDLTWEVGSGQIVRQEIEVGELTSVELATSGRVLFRQGEAAPVVMLGEDNILPHLNVEVRAGRLFLEQDSAELWPTREVLYLVQAPAVDAFVLSGSGGIVSDGLFAAPALDLSLPGSGGLELAVDVDLLRSSIDGSGGIALTGHAARHEIDIAGSGGLTAFDLETDTTSASISGSGSAEVYALQALEAEISGSGGVVYGGRPELITNISGSGGVVRR